MVLNRIKKKKAIQLSLLIIGIALIISIYFSDTIKNKISPQEVKKADEIEDELDDVTVFEKLEYRGEDNNGNKFVIFSEYSNFKEESPEIINMQNILCYFYFKDGTTLEVRSKEGVYNNVALDISFAKNVNMFYIENALFSDKADYSNSDNRLFVEGNVKTQSPNGEVFADKLNFDFIDKKLKISMYNNEEKVNVKTIIKWKKVLE